MATTATAAVSAGSPHAHDQQLSMADSLYPAVAAAHGGHYRSSPWDMAVRRCGTAAATAAPFSLDDHQLLARAATSLVDVGGGSGSGVCADMRSPGMPMPAFLRHHQENLYAQMQPPPPPHPLYMQDQLHQQQQHHQQQQQQQQQHQHHHQQQQQQQQQHQQDLSHHHHHMQAMVGYGGYHNLAYPTNPHMVAAASHQQLQHQQLHHQAQQHEQQQLQQQQQQQQQQLQQQHQQQCMSPTSHYASVAAATAVELMDYDPRELEAFAERFKQRRIKLGVTQADVGKALGNLKLPGVGSLSQSTICRFESLTLSHNNMIALKPVLQAWLEEAEHVAMERQKNPDVYGDGLDKKRKRTSITDAEKRSLEAYFHVQPRPSSEKIAQIADKLNLKKNVVRVWFCNQRQKQKRMKFATPGMHPSPH